MDAFVEVINKWPIQKKGILATGEAIGFKFTEDLMVGIEDSAFLYKIVDGLDFVLFL
jgi:hypothetical protein